MVLTMDEYTISIIKQLLEVFLIPLLGYLTKKLVDRLDNKLQADEKRTKTEIAQKHLEQLNKLIFECVKATNQTLVNPLKEKGEFDEVAQNNARIATYNKVCLALTDETKEYLDMFIYDLETYIIDVIEASIEEAKKK